MRFCTLRGKLESVRASYKYLIDWDKSSVSGFQKQVKSFLMEYWRNDMVFEELPVVGTRLCFDFYNDSKKIVVESDGDQHYTYSKFFHKNKKEFLNQLIRDDTKESFCDLNNIRLVRILPSDKLNKETAIKFELI